MQYSRYSVSRNIGGGSGGDRGDASPPKFQVEGTVPLKKGGEKRGEKGGKRKERKKKGERKEKERKRGEEREEDSEKGGYFVSLGNRLLASRPAKQNCAQFEALELKFCQK